MIFKTLLVSALLVLFLAVAAILFRIETMREEMIVPKTYGLNDVSLRMRATWIDPMATDLDPRRLLILGANEIESLDPGNDTAKEMRLFWEDPFSPDRNPRQLLRKGADEIDRLQSEIRFPEKERDVRGGSAP